MSTNSLTPNPLSRGKYVFTPANFDRKRITLDAKPSYMDSFGATFPAKYTYITQEGKEVVDYIRAAPSPTLSMVYECSQMQEKDGGQPKDNAKYGFTFGSRVVAIGPKRRPKVHEDETGKFLRVETFPRTFKVQVEPSGNAYRGDDKPLTPEHVAAIEAYYNMCEVLDCEIVEQLATNLYKAGKSCTFSDKFGLIKSGEKDPFQDIHAKVAQFANKKDPKATDIALSVTTGQEGTKLMPYTDFFARSRGARVSVWPTFPSAFLNSSGIPMTRCTVDRVLLKSLGPEGASRESGMVNMSEIPDDEAVDPELIKALSSHTSSVPSPKRARVAEEEAVGEVSFADDDISVFN